MTNNSWQLLTCCLLLLCGCSSGKDAKPFVPQRSLADDLVGKWRLVRADDKPPAEQWIKSLEVDIAANGTWTSKMEGEGYLRGMNGTGGGTWSLADGELTLTLDGPGNPKGTETFKSKVRIESGHLMVDPDHFMQIRKKGPLVAAEYER